MCACQPPGAKQAYLQRKCNVQDEVMKIMPVQKQTRAGQRTRFKAFVVVGDHNGHVGLGVKCAKEVGLDEALPATRCIASAFQIAGCHCNQSGSCCSSQGKL